MLIDGEAIIRKQLRTRKETHFTAADGRETPLAPARTVPAVADGGRHLSLNGVWKVKRWPWRGDEAALTAPRQSTARWETVEQPGKVFYADPEAESKPLPGWNRVTLAHIEEDDGAVLRKSVTLPKDWRGKRIFLRFDAIYPAGRIYLDGVFLREHLSGLTPVEIDVTERVKPGRRVTVAVRLLRRHRFVQMDMVRHACEFAGLAQEACFHAVEPCHMAEYQLIPELNRALDAGTVAGTVTVHNGRRRQTSASVRLELLDEDGKVVAKGAGKGKVKAGGEKTVRVRARLPNPRLWNDEMPNLYTVRLTLAVAGQAKQTLSYRTGFRRFDLSARGPKLNGNPVKFRGVNHLTFHPDHGMYTPRAWLRENLAMMKKANVNAIRTHFLGPRCLAELCSEMGIYLLQELPIDWGTDYIADPEWVGPALMRLEGGVRRDRHQPAVMVWSVGNENMPSKKAEAAEGWNHMAIYDQFVKTLDPSRPTMFPPPGPANKIEGIFELRVGDIADTHYTFKHVKKFLKRGRIKNPNSWEADMTTHTREWALKRGWKGVWFSSEYCIVNLIPDLLNAPYVSIIADRKEDPLSGKNTMQVFIDRLRDEWGLMRAEPTCLGGAFFPWICAGAGLGEGGNPWGWVRWAEDADWGVMTADLTPKPFFWAMRALFSPVWFPRVLKVKKGQKQIEFEVENQYNQLDLADCTVRTQMGAGGGWMGQQRAFRDVKVRCRPGRKAKVRIPFWNPATRNALENGQPALCRIHLLQPDGFRAITHDMILLPSSASRKMVETILIGPDAEL